MTKPLDLSYVMQHALLAGQMGIRWENYDPTECAAYHRQNTLQARCDKLEAERGSYRELAFDAIHDLYRIMLLFRSNPQDVYGFAKDCRKALMKRFGKIDDARSVVDGGE